MMQILTATMKCLTNHLISHIPSYTIRHGWYRKMQG
jgi:hypothetical protein